MIKTGLLKNGASINFVKGKTEWNATDIVFEIARKAARPSCASGMSVWFRQSSAMTAARELGALMILGLHGQGRVNLV